MLTFIQEDFTVLTQFLCFYHTQNNQLWDMVKLITINKRWKKHLNNKENKCLSFDDKNSLQLSHLKKNMDGYE